jgi:hypothetical protein
MSSFLLAKSIIKLIDKIRRAFFWATEESCSGAQCLVAWRKVCSPKVLGGLGIKNIDAQNVCLFLEFCYKILHSHNLPWKDWLLHHSPYAHHSKNPSFLGNIITKHMPILASITQCKLGDGKKIFFGMIDGYFQNHLLMHTLPYSLTTHKKCIYA